MNQEDKIHKVSIIPHGIGAMGYTIQRPTEDRYLVTKEDLENKMAVLMAGRAAEMLIFGHLSTGASDDLAKATNIAREMVMRYGMTDQLGFVSYDEKTSNFLDTSDGFSKNSYSDKTAKEIDDAVKKIVMTSYFRAYHFLTERRELLENSAKKLIEQETLNEDQLKTMFKVNDTDQPTHEISIH